MTLLERSRVGIEASNGNPGEAVPQLRKEEPVRRLGALSFKEFRRLSREIDFGYEEKPTLVTCFNEEEFRLVSDRVDERVSNPADLDASLGLEVLVAGLVRGTISGDCYTLCKGFAAGIKDVREGHEVYEIFAEGSLVKGVGVEGRGKVSVTCSCLPAEPGQEGSSPPWTYQSIPSEAWLFHSEILRFQITYSGDSPTKRNL